MFRRLLAIVLVLAGLYAGYWWIGATATETAFRGWLDERRAQGWIAEAAVDTRGFPSRFDTTLTGLTIADPATGWGWSAPFFQTLMLSYAPNKAIAAWPGEQRIDTPLGPVEITSESMRASAVFAPSPSLPVEDVVLIARKVEAMTPFGRFAAPLARFGTARDPELPNGHRIGLLLEGFEPPAGLVGLLPEAARQEGAALLRIDGKAGFDRPLDRTAAEGAPPRLTALDIGEAHLNWGGLDLVVFGALTFPDGVPEGRLQVRAEGHEGLLAILRGNGLAGGLAAGALSAMASADGTPGRLSAPLTFEDGLMSFGPIPLGPAPRIAPPAD